jgi:hypothetical protein
VTQVLQETRLRSIVADRVLRKTCHAAIGQRRDANDLLGPVSRQRQSEMQSDSHEWTGTVHTLSRMTDEELSRAYDETPRPNVYGTERLRRQRLPRSPVSERPTYLVDTPRLRVRRRRWSHVPTRRRALSWDAHKLTALPDPVHW